MTRAQDNAPGKQNYGSIGCGYGSGTYFSSAFTHVEKHFGMSLSFKEMWYRAKDLPEDYDGFYRNNNITMLSLMVVIEARPNPNSNVWLGFEVGPSYINHRKEVEVANPDYLEPWAWGLLPDMNKYIRDNIVRNTIGFVTRVKCDFTFSKSVGLELALFGVINRYKPYGGIECHFLFGRVR